MAIHQYVPAATRSGHGFLARLSSSLPPKLVGTFLPSNTSSCTRPPVHFLAFLSRGPRTFPRIFASSVAGPPEGDDTTGLVDIRPRMPDVPEPRPKPTTAVAVVEEYLDKLWRDFFTKPHQWFDNRLRRRAPKYADYKNKLTKEGLWITAKWNPPWVRTELSLMTNFRAVPYDDPMWAKKKSEEDAASEEKPAPVAPGAWLRDEIKSKSSNAGPGPARVDVWRRSDSGPNSTPSASGIGTEQEG